MKTPGSGRKKGTPNKLSAAVKDMVIEALNNKGGVEYLERQAEQNPVAFMSLVGRIIPTQIAGDPDNPLVTIKRIERVVISAPIDEPTIKQDKPTAH